MIIRMQSTGSTNYNPASSQSQGPGEVKLLALDTSTRATVMGLMLDDHVIERTTPEVQTHSREILPSIQALLKDGGVSLEDLDGIVYGRGPGSFTGLRISVGIVQGLAYGANLPVVPVSSMAVLARSAFRDTGINQVVVTLSARLEEVYFGGYFVDSEKLETVIEEGVLDVGELPIQEAANRDAWVLAGNVMQLAGKTGASLGIAFDSLIEREVPGLEDLLALGVRSIEEGKLLSALEAEPVYLREEVASRPSGN